MLKIAFQLRGLALTAVALCPPSAGEVADDCANGSFQTITCEKLRFLLVSSPNPINRKIRINLNADNLIQKPTINKYSQGQKDGNVLQRCAEDKESKNLLAFICLNHDSTIKSLYFALQR